MSQTIQNAIKRGNRLLDAGRYMQAEGCFRQALARLEPLEHREGLRLSLAWGQLGRICCLRHKTGAGRRYFNRAADIQKRLFPPDHEAVVDLLDAAVAAFPRQPKKSAALVIALAERMYGRGYPVVKAVQEFTNHMSAEDCAAEFNLKEASPRLKTAAKQKAKERSAVAMKCLQYAKEILTRVFGSRHFYLAEVYDYIGQLAAAAGDLPAAIQACKAELRIRKKADIGSPEGFENCLWCLAYLYEKAGDLPAAFVVYDELLATVTDTEGGEPADEKTARAQVAQARLYCELHDYGKALALVKKALDLWSVIGPDGCDYHDCLDLQDRIRQQQGQAGRLKAGPTEETKTNKAAEKPSEKRKK